MADVVDKTSVKVADAVDKATDKVVETGVKVVEVVERISNNTSVLQWVAGVPKIVKDKVSFCQLVNKNGYHCE